MNDSLTLFYYILSKAFNTLFGIYFFNGVSLGMIFVSGFIFTVMLKYLLAVPRLRVGGYRNDFSKNDSSKNETKSS